MILTVSSLCLNCIGEIGIGSAQPVARMIERHSVADSLLTALVFEGLCGNRENLS